MIDKQEVKTKATAEKNNPEVKKAGEKQKKIEEDVVEAEKPKDTKKATPVKVASPKKQAESPKKKAEAEKIKK